MIVTYVCNIVLKKLSVFLPFYRQENQCIHVYLLDLYRQFKGGVGATLGGCGVTC